MYQSISQFCWPDSKSNEANRGRHCAQEIVVSQQYINHLTKTIFPTQLIESLSSISQWMTQASWLFSSSHFHSAQIKQARGPPSRNQNILMGESGLSVRVTNTFCLRNAKDSWPYSVPTCTWQCRRTTFTTRTIQTLILAMFNTYSK